MNEDKQKLSLTKEAIKDLKQIGSITQSSKFLSNRILREIDFSKNLKIIELGPGNGVFTLEILKKMNLNSSLISYETHPSFVEILKKINDNRFKVNNKSALNISNLDFGEYDYVISSLPIANLKSTDKIKLFKNIDLVLKKDGKLVQYQYSLLDYNLIKRIFPSCKIGFCLRNIPPAFLYIANK